MRSIEDIYSLYVLRQRLRHPMFTKMREIRDTYNGDLVLPLPEIDRLERPAVANLALKAIDGHGQRIASTMPGLLYPPTKPGQDRAEKMADVRRRANLGWWEHSKMRLLMRRRARWLVAYGLAPVKVVPDFKASVPAWRISNPLSTFPAQTANPDDCNPEDCIYAYTQPLHLLQQRYGRDWVVFPGDMKPEDNIDVIEYNDADEIVLIAVAACGDDYHGELPDNKAYVATQKGRAIAVQLARVPNRAGTCLAVVPGRITLDRLAGMFDSFPGLQQSAAKLFALEMHAVTQAVFPEEWLVSRQQEQAEIVSMADGRQGVVGIVSGGEMVTRNINPGTQTYPTMDRLERHARIDGALPAEWGGESGSNIRTGRRGDSVMSATVDFPVQEAHEIFEFSLQEENRRAVAVAKGWFGDKAQSFYVHWKGAKGHVDYVPNAVFDTDNNVVSYAQAGADINELAVSGLQRVGTGAMSKHTFMEIDPLIDDPVQEKQRVIVEALESAALSGLQNQAAQGALPLVDVARITQLVLAEGKDLYEAVQTAQREAQERQASSGPVGAPDGPVAPGAPEAQPGLALPGQGAEVPEEVPAGEPSLQNLNQLLFNLRAPQGQVA